MFIGHFAVGLGAKRIAPSVSLGTLFLAVQFVDLLWPAFVIIGLESFSIQPGITVVTPLDFTNYPYSHSLLMSGVWAALFGAVYTIIRKVTIKTATALSVCVISHWFLDFLSHRPDLPITLSNELRVGLGLWNSLPATIIVELFLFGASGFIYAKATKPRNRVGNFAFWGLIIFLSVIYAANMFGPPPPNTNAVAWSAQAIWLLIAWGYWIDRHREMRRA
jgi:hypothetical protein